MRLSKAKNHSRYFAHVSLFNPPVKHDFKILPSSSICEEIGQRKVGKLAQGHSL